MVDYTKIQLDYTFIAVGMRQYILMHPNHLEDCQMFDDTLVCSSVLLQTHKNVNSCLASLFWDMDIRTIAQVCKIKYYHNINVPSQTLEDEQYLLLANVKRNWSLYCLDDSIPRRTSGERFALIKKDSLCRCKIIIDNDHYIQQKIRGCDEYQMKINISYPINSLVIFHLQDLMHNIDSSFDFLQTHPLEVNFKTPTLHIMKVLNRSQVLHEPSHDGVAFQKVKDMLASDRQQFIAAEDLLAEQNKIKGWFSGGNIVRGLPFVVSLVGVVAAIICIAYCYKQHKGNKLASAMTTFALGKLPTAQARPTLNHEHAMAARNEFNYRLYLVIAIFVTYMIYRLGKFL